MSPNLMTSLNIDEESYSPSIHEQKVTDSKPDLNTNDQKLLKYHKYLQNIQHLKQFYATLQNFLKTSQQ